MNSVISPSKINSDHMQKPNRTLLTLDTFPSSVALIREVFPSSSKSPFITSKLTVEHPDIISIKEKKIVQEMKKYMDLTLIILKTLNALM